MRVFFVQGLFLRPRELYLSISPPSFALLASGFSIEKNPLSVRSFVCLGFFFSFTFSPSSDSFEILSAAHTFLFDTRAVRFKTGRPVVSHSLSLSLFVPRRDFYKYQQ